MKTVEHNKSGLV